VTPDGRELGGGKRPEARETDSLKARTRQRKRRLSEAQTRVAEAIDRVHHTNESEQAAYRKALGALRQKPEEVREAVTDLELSSPNDHNLHWTLYYMLADLEMPELAPMLVDAASRDLPEITDTTACETIDDDKILVAMMAVEGLERIASQEPEAAMSALMEVVERQPHVAVRTAAVQAILQVRPDADRDVAGLLPDDQLFMLEARRAPVEQLSATPERSVPKRSSRRGPKLESDMDAPQSRERTD
jgi:hypothetical protein